MYSHLKRGDTVVVAGPAGIGRTGYALNLASTALEDGDTVLFVDAGYDLNPDRLGGMATNRNLVVVHPDTIEVASELVRTAVQHGVDMVILDGVDRLSSSRRSREAFRASISLMNLAKVLDGCSAVTSVFLVQTRHEFGVFKVSGVRFVEESTSTPIVKVKLARGAAPGTVDVHIRRDDDKTTTTIRDVAIARREAP